MKQLFPVLFLSAVTTLGCQTESANKNTKEIPKQVKVVRAEERKLPRILSVSGTLAAEEEVVLSMKVTGRVQDVYVDLGSRVSRAQPLVKLEPADFVLRVRQAEAAYQQARVRLGLDAEGKDDAANLDPEQTGVVKQARALMEEARLNRERIESLFKENLVPRSQLDNAVAAYQVAEARYQDAIEEVRTRQAVLIQRRAELEIARKQLADSAMSAPISGAIQERLVSPGQYVASGDAVLKMVRIDPLRLKLAVPERESGNVRIGQSVLLRVEGDTNQHKGTVSRISPAISADNRTLMIEAEVPNQQGFLRPGSYARAEIIIESEHTAVLVPSSSVVVFAGLTKVITIENNQAVEKSIKIGRRSADSVEVLEGLSGGEPVVLQPSNLAEGDKVTPIW